MTSVHEPKRTSAGPLRRGALRELRQGWVKSKCLNREEFVVVGWTDPEGSRSHIGALLLGYYTDDGGCTKQAALAQE